MTKKHITYILLILIPVIVLVGIALVVFGTPSKNQSNNATTSKKKYIALGDSVASGAGLAGSVDASACDRNDESYPFVVASKEGLDVRSVACSGATILQGVIGPQTINGVVIPPQVENVDSKDSIVTITVGANDIGWSKLLLKCLTATCGTKEDNATLQDVFLSFPSNYITMIKEVEKRIGPETKVYVTGYYSLYPSALSECTTSPGLDDAELQWISEQTFALNATIRNSVSTFSFVRYMEVNVTGHELCTTAPWVQSTVFPAPFHPTAEGQNAIADKLITNMK